MEMKDGRDSAGIYDAVVEIYQYWRQYEYGDAVVLSDDKQVDVDVFAISTQYSPKGRLFRREPEDDGLTGRDREKGVRETYPNKDAYYAADQRPQYAYARSEAILPLLYRLAWDEAEKRRERNRSNIETGIGILLSDEGDGNPQQTTLEDPTPQPKIQFYRGNDGPRWIEL